jgi:hypothetical protein
LRSATSLMPTSLPYPLAQNSNLFLHNHHPLTKCSKDPQQLC